MRNSGFANGYNVKRELGLIGWMILQIVRVGEWLAFEGVVIVVASYQAHAIFACFQSRCYRMVHWLGGNILLSYLKWKREGKGVQF